ncbi:MAG: ABC-type transport system, mce(Mammalian cell entry)-related protein, partial [Modestobacter sp.]|nr:ABC-type transport system, mce(Mammalian cell entry)-related protein [Modestobacter sp.]
MITRKVRLQLIGFALVAVLFTSYLSFKYVGLDRLLLGNGYDVAADFSDSGGIFVNAEVTYRGVGVGRVSDMQLTDSGVRVTLTVNPDAPDIPADTSAVVANRSAVGEQYVDLRPPDDAGPYLADGAVIPQDRTSIPIPVEQLLLDVDGLVGSIDTADLRVVVDELGTAFAGAGDDLSRLLDNGDLLLTRAEQSLPQTLRLITDGQTVLDTQAESRSAIQSWASDLRALTDTLVSSDPDIRSLLVNAPDAGAALQTLVQDAGPSLGPLVRYLDVLNKVTIPRLAGVEQMLATYPDVVSGGFSVVRNDGGTMRAHFGFVLNSGDPQPCTTGYISSGAAQSPGAVLSQDTTGVRCDVVNG